MAPPSLPSADRVTTQCQHEWWAAVAGRAEVLKLKASGAQSSNAGSSRQNPSASLSRPVAVHVNPSEAVYSSIHRVVWRSSSERHRSSRAAALQCPRHGCRVWIRPHPVADPRGYECRESQGEPPSQAAHSQPPSGALRVRDRSMAPACGWNDRQRLRTASTLWTGPRTARRGHASPPVTWVCLFEQEGPDVMG